MVKKRISSELAVGIAVLIGITCLFYMSFRIGKFGSFQERGYEVSVTIPDANGLERRSPVEIAGVNVGKVKSVKLDGYKAQTTLLIRNDVKIPADSKVAVRTQGVLGDKYLEIIPGKDTQNLAAGDKIKEFVPAPDVAALFANVSSAAKTVGETIGEFKGIVGEREKENLKQSLENIRVATGDFKELVGTSKGGITRIVTNIENVSGDLKNGKGTLGKLIKDEKLYSDARDAVTSLKKVSSDLEQGKGTLGKLLKDEAMYGDVQDAVKNVKDITEGIKKGEGTLGKLAKDESLYKETEKAMKKIQKGAEGLQEMTPVTILGTIFGTFF